MSAALTKIKDKQDSAKVGKDKYRQRRLRSANPGDWSGLDISGGLPRGHDVEVHEYSGPAVGYTVIFHKEIAGVPHIKMHHYGPEKHRDKNSGKWIAVPTDPRAADD